MVGPLVVADLMGQVGAVLILVIVFASLASSLDSLLAATSDLLTEDVYRRLLRPRASGTELRMASRGLVLLLGTLSIVICWQRLTTLAEMIQFTGAFVASTIWPIAAGLYWEKTNRMAVTVAMIAGTGAGLTAYFAIGFFTAALVGAAVSMVCVLAGTWLFPQSFEWRDLARLRGPEER
jgi:Na+/proline symporter